MAVAVAHASSSGSSSVPFPGAVAVLARRVSVVPGLETRRFRPVRRLPELPPDDDIPARSRIVLRGGAVCLR
jgi:hypothetical protein